MQKQDTRTNNSIGPGVFIDISLAQRLAERGQAAGTPETSASPLPSAALNELKQFTFAL